MKKTSLIKYLISYVIFGIVAFLVVSVYTSSALLESLISKQVDTLYKEANTLSSQYILGLYNGENSKGRIWTSLSIMDDYLASRIWVISPNGEVLLRSDRPVTYDNSPITEFNGANLDKNYYQIGNFYNSFTEDHLSVICPVLQAYKIQGYVTLHYPMRFIYAEQENLSKEIYLVALSLYIASFIPFGVFLICFYSPLSRIKKIAMNYSDNNFSEKIEYHISGEFKELSDAIDYLALQLDTLEESQRNFIANISHDFRSPLTSIKGYLEAMIDGTIPVENQEKYFNILLFETERLNKLTSNLLTLNSFDSAGGRLDLSEFDIVATIKETLASFENRCEKSNISFELLLSAPKLYVYADLGKIQQVLHNLIDNAIKFSRNDSVITIETTEQGEKAFISIKDTGIGIPKDSLARIWDRFYKTDLSRGKDKKGTGLGLTIVKEIIQAHNENIDVISTPDVGTKFVFSLSKKH